MQQDGVEARIAEKDFERTLRGWVTAKDGLDLLPNGSKHAISSIISPDSRIQESTNLCG
jgi:hypothetical protein